MKEKRSDYYLLLGAMLLSIVPLLILSLILTYVFTTNVYRQNISSLSATAGSVSDYLIDSYELALKGSTDLSKMETFQDYFLHPNNEEYKKQADDILSTSSLADPQIIASMLIAKNGAVLTSTNFEFTGDSVKYADVFKQLQNGKKTASTIELIDNQPYMRVGVRITDANDNFLGIFTRILSLPMIRSFALQTNESGNALILIGTRGEMLQYLPYDYNFYGHLIESEEVDDLTGEDIRGQIRDSEEGYFTYEDADKTYVATYEQVPNLNWTVVLSQLRATLMYEINRFQLFTIFLTIIVLLIIIILGRVLTKPFFRQYHDLEDTLEQYLDDNYAARVRKSAITQISLMGNLVNKIGDLLQEKERELKAAKKKYFDSQNLDQNTNLMSRSAIYSKIAQSFGQSPNQALVLLNISGYKELNNLYGSSFGMQIVSVAARILRSLKRNNMFIARLNDDDFLIFISDFRAEEDVLEFVQNAIRRISEVRDIDGQQVSIGANAGIVYVDGTISSRTIWMKQADIANRYAKKSPKHYYIFEQNKDTYSDGDDLSDREKSAQQNIINDFLTSTASDFFIMGDSRIEENTDHESVKQEDKNHQKD